MIMSSVYLDYEYLMYIILCTLCFLRRGFDFILCIEYVSEVMQVQCCKKAYEKY